ncbi:MAG: tRNA(His) 5-end guanylyltransferase [Actinomycetia bacterium]|nr:tRNA(His) 5-end guanylyltransferase [Actinomycetes bacterium]
MPSDKTSLGDRMKGYESVTRHTLPRRTYTVVRVDGRAFHGFLRRADKPFDYNVMAAMDAVGEELCTEMSGSVFAYTQSDECSVLLTDFTSHGTQPWFGGIVQKIASIAASSATVAFNEAYGRPYGGPRALFDARVFTVPDPVEVANYFLWRQRDAVRNSIQMAGQARFSHKELNGVSTGEIQEMLWSQHGINWNDYQVGAKRGRVTVRHVGERDVTYTDKRTQQETTTTAMRSWWETGGAPHFTANPDGFLADTIPSLPSLSTAVREDQPA